MASPLQPERITPEQYLESERLAEANSEYFQGVVVAMAGASLSHNRIVQALGLAVGNQLAGRPCEGFGTDMRLRASENHYFYPDYLVVCGEPQVTDDRHDNLTNPTVVFEVLSASTEKFDRGVKLETYLSIPSLLAYVLVAQDRPRVEVVTKESRTRWSTEIFAGLDAVVFLPQIDLTLKLEDLYARVDFPG